MPIALKSLFNLLEKNFSSAILEIICQVLYSLYCTHAWIQNSDCTLQFFIESLKKFLMAILRRPQTEGRWFTEKG